MKDLLFDTDSLLYKINFGINKNELSNWKDYIKKMVEKSLKNTNTNEIIFCFSSNNNFRYKILQSYKFNRSKEKNNTLDIYKNYIINNYKTLEYNNLEADDVISYNMTKFPNNYKIASIDKDLKQVEGTLYNWDKETLEYNNKYKCNNFFFKQCIIGDSTDFISGIPGIGDKRSEEIFKDCIKDGYNNFYKNLEKWYNFFGLNKDYMLKQIRCLKLLDKNLYIKESEKILYFNV